MHRMKLLRFQLINGLTMMPFSSSFNTCTLPHASDKAVTLPGGIHTA
jgi:hypothetical protein